MNAAATVIGKGNDLHALCYNHDDMSPAPSHVPPHAANDASTMACPECGLEQQVPGVPPRFEVLCARCHKRLARSPAWGLAGGLALSLTVLFLLVPANLLPLMRARLGASSSSRDTGSTHAEVSGLFQGLMQGIGTHEAYIGAGVQRLWNQGSPLLALLFAALALVSPLLWALLTVTVFGTLKLHRHPPWLGRAFRYSEGLRLWAMPDVLVLAGFVVYMRTETELSAQVATGGLCLIGAAAALLAWPALVDPRTVWRQIAPDQTPEPGRRSFCCDACNLCVPESLEDQPCPRCHRRLRRRKYHALGRTTALVLASYLLCAPAYYFPMSYTLQPNGLHTHRIIGSVILLAHDGYWYLAVIIAFVSIGIPFLKLTGLSWLLLRVRFPTHRHLLARAWVYRITHRIGRYSYTDPFIVALMSPLLAFRGLVDVRPGPAALPFALVVALTMLAVRSFDPRLMWDAAAGAP